ncbi:hypothetical protein BDV19DRAFT_367510 [Aspergillus venezuelensis]
MRIGHAFLMTFPAGSCSVSHLPQMYFADQSSLWFQWKEGAIHAGRAFLVSFTYHCDDDRIKRSFLPFGYLARSTEYSSPIFATLNLNPAAIFKINRLGRSTL